MYFFFKKKILHLVCSTIKDRLDTLNHAGYFEVEPYNWKSLNICWEEFQTITGFDQIKVFILSKIAAALCSNILLSTTTVTTISTILKGFSPHFTITTSACESIDMLISLYMCRNFGSDGVLVFTPSTISEIIEIGSIDSWFSNKQQTFSKLKTPKIIAIIYSNSDCTPPVTIFYVLKK